MSQYKCDNCGFTGDESKFNDAHHLSERLTPGGIYTDLECPMRDCGSLAYPVKDEPNVVILGGWRIELGGDENEYLFIENTDRAGQVHVKNEDEGYIVDIWSTDGSECVATTGAEWNEMEPE